MRRRSGAFLLPICVVLLAPRVLQAEVILVYRQQTGSQVDRIEISEQALPRGAVLQVVASSGEAYHIESDTDGAVIFCTFEFPRGHTSWTARREGARLLLEGTVQGRPTSRTFPIDDHPWYESVERSLQSFAVSGSTEPRLFWMIEPYGGTAFLMSGRIKGREPVTVNGVIVPAVRITVRPAGILSFLWSSEYWYAPQDGTFLRSESVRNVLPIVPRTSIELLEDRRTTR